jgi:hypothetical protein
LKDVVDKLKDMGYTATDNEDDTYTIEKDGEKATIDEDFNVEVGNVIWIHEIIELDFVCYLTISAV